MEGAFLFCWDTGYLSLDMSPRTYREGHAAGAEQGVRCVAHLMPHTSNIHLSSTFWIPKDRYGPEFFWKCLLLQTFFRDKKKKMLTEVCSPAKYIPTFQPRLNSYPPSPFDTEKCNWNPIKWEPWYCLAWIWWTAASLLDEVFATYSCSLQSPSF